MTLKLNGYSTASSEVPRGAGVADVAHGPVRHVALGRRRVRVLLRLHRGREQPVVSGALRGPHPGRAARRRPRRATTSPRTWPTTPSTGCASRRRSCPTSRSSCTSRPAPPTPRTTCPRSGRTSTRASSRTAGTASAEITFARQKELGVIRPDAKLTARHAEIPAWDEMPDELQADPRARDGGLRRVPGAHRPPHRPARRRHRAARHPRRHAGLLHHRRQRGLCRGHDQRCLQRDGQLQRHGRARNARVHDLQARRARHARRPTTTTPWGGRGPWTPPTSGPSRSRRTGAAPATAPSSTGPNGIDGRGRDPLAVLPRHRRRPDHPGGGRAYPSRLSVNGVQQAPIEGTSMLYSLRRRRRRRATRPPVLRDVRQPRASTTRAGARSPSTAPRGSWWAPSCRPSTTTCGSSTTAARTGPRPTICPPRCPRSLRELQRLWLIEAVKYNVLPLDDRGVERFNADLAGRPQLDHGHLPASRSRA